MKYLIRYNELNESISKRSDDLYSEEDMKNFGLWLGNNFKKNKNKSIDDLFNDFIKE